jgi:HEPN domain-containing protein
MSDPRLEALTPASDDTSAHERRISAIRIQAYRFFADQAELSIDGKNLLVYGENGTGKSTLFRALALLAGQGLSQIGQARNIFSDSNPEIEFAFTNGTSLTLDADTEELPDAFAFLKPLSIFVPMLDYKRLLRVHFSAEANTDHINIYDMVRELFKDYPHVGGGKLSDIRSFPDYFKILDALLNKELLPTINEMIAVFDNQFSLTGFELSTELDEAGRPNPQIQMKLEYRETPIDRYHIFLNEARLSALAISMYFASILRLMSTAGEQACRILVLDDLLISLDMSNRLRLLEILKTRFGHFQLFFFTHDKELFELYRGKMDWAAYEFYLDDSAAIPAAFIKRGKTELERAKVFFASRDYDACAMLLRKAFERLLKNYLPLTEQRNRNCEDIDLSGLIAKAIVRTQGEVKSILEKLNLDRSHILNPLCHSDDRAVYTQELRSAIQDLEKLIKYLSEATFKS